jgi:hypothetical protein
LVSTAVKKGVSDMTNLMKKNLELKGVSKEEIDKIVGVEPPKEEVPWNEINATKKDH